MKGILVVMLMLVLILSACGDTSDYETEPITSPTPTTVTAIESETTIKKITLTDSPTILDLSPLLPQHFEHIDAASEGMSNEDMGLGPDVSEVELFFSEYPYQMIYTMLTIIESRIERSGADAIFKDEQQIKNILIENILLGLEQEGVYESEVDTKITYPHIGDFAVKGEGQILTSGIEFGFDILWFRINKVYIYLYSAYISSEKQELDPLALEIAHRVSMYSQ